MFGRIIVFVASALLCAPALFAQVPVSVSSRVGVHSAYEGRGLTFTEGPVLQGSLDVGSTVRSVDVFVGAWGNFEVFESATGRRMLPTGVTGPSEINLYAGISRVLGPGSLEFGVIQFLFPAGFDFSAPGPITELYGSAGVATWGAPTFTAYYDFSARGWYMQLAARHEVPLRFGTIWVGGEVGGSHGQAGDQEYYAADGLTHAGLSAGVGWQVRSVRVEPHVRWTHAVDEAALSPASLGRRGQRNKGVCGINLAWQP